MTDQPKALSIIDTYAASRNMERAALIATLTKTIMPKEATSEDMVAFLQIAYRFDLDPWAREIFCIVNKGRVVPYVSVDGYAKIANRQPEYDGVEFDFEQDVDGRFLACTATLWRKDRARPTRVTEFMSECYKDSEPWRKSPARMLRHRAFIQAVRLAFGISGALDEDIADHAPVAAPETPLERAEPPKAPKAPPSAKAPPQAAAKPEMPKGEVIEDDKGVSDPEAYTMELNDRLNEARDVEQLNQIWLDFDPVSYLQPNKQAIAYAQSLYDKAKARLEKPAAS